MQILTVDIETSPNIGPFFQTRNVTIPEQQIIHPSRVFSVAAKWDDEDEVMFWRGDTEKRRRKMIKAVWSLLDEADAVVHYNGCRFDIPKLRGECVLYGLAPWAPFKQIDLLPTVRSFGFVSSKLSHAVRRLDLDLKQTNEGMALWLSCMGYGQFGDREASWLEMESYNRQDVVVTEQLFERIRPWMNNLPHPGLYLDNDEALQHSCQRCGGTAMTKRGFAFTPLGKYPRFRCKSCGSYSRGKQAVATVGLRGAA